MVMPFVLVLSCVPVLQNLAQTWLDPMAVPTWWVRTFNIAGQRSIQVLCQRMLMFCPIWLILRNFIHTLTIPMGLTRM